MSNDTGAWVAPSANSFESEAAIEAIEVAGVEGDMEAELYHPMFSLPEADVVVQSRDGVRFRLPSLTLRMTSDVFRTTLSLPPPASKKPPFTLSKSPNEIIYLDERKDVLEKLFKIVCGLGLHPWELSTISDVEELLHAAEKYEMNGVLSYARTGITSERYGTDSMRLYALCRRYGWDEEAEGACKLTLKVDIREPTYTATMRMMSGEDLSKLIRLRWKRREVFKSNLDSDINFEANHTPYRCTACRKIIDVHVWREWKWMMLEEMLRFPCGETVLSERVLESQVVRSLFNLQCSSPQCSKVCFNREVTCRKIRDCLAHLPTSVEDE